MTDLPFPLLLGAILGVTLFFRRLATVVGQPQVVGEIVAGLAVGLVLVAASQQWQGHGGPSSMAGLSSSLSLLGNFGLIFLVVNALFQERAEEPSTDLFHERRTLWWTTVMNVVPTFLGAAWLAQWYAREHAVESAGAFVLLVATASAISAVPVLARLITELNLTGSRVANLSFKVACWTDLLGWIGVGTALALHDGGNPYATALRHLVVVMSLVLVLLAIRGAMRKYLTNSPQVAGKVLLITLLSVAGVTHMAHLHFVFGAFLVGSVFASERKLAREWLAHATWVTERLFCPVFFVVAGMNLIAAGSISLAELAWAGAFLVVCIASKLVPLFVSSRLLGMSFQESTLLAVLLNTRGLMELVILSVGMSAGIFTSSQYAIFVMVAVVTTVISMPLCRLILISKKGAVQRA